MLTREFCNRFFVYRDGNLYRKTKIYRKAGSLNGQGYWQIGINEKRYLAHRIIFLMHKGYLPEFVDHIDGNKLNNKIENLREATRNQNGFNAKQRKDNTSGYKNVSWNKKCKKWIVKTTFNKKSIYFGLFEDLELASLVAKEVRNKFHGNFAKHF